MEGISFRIKSLYFILQYSASLAFIMLSVTRIVGYVSYLLSEFLTSGRSIINVCIGETKLREGNDIVSHDFVVNSGRSNAISMSL